MAFRSSKTIDYEYDDCIKIGTKQICNTYIESVLLVKLQNGKIVCPAVTVARPRKGAFGRVVSEDRQEYGLSYDRYRDVPVSDDIEDYYFIVRRSWKAQGGSKSEWQWFSVTKKRMEDVLNQKNPKLKFPPEAELKTLTSNKDILAICRDLRLRDIDTSKK